MQLSSKHRQVLRMIASDAKKFASPLVSMIPEHLKKEAQELEEAGLIERVAGGYLLTEKGREFVE